MRAYLLIMTSGILFFIITVVTVIHVMSSRTLLAQYNNLDLIQQNFELESVRTIVSHLVSNGKPFNVLPGDLGDKYTVISQANNVGGTTYAITAIETNRVSTFNITLDSNQAALTTFDSESVLILNNHISNVKLNSDQPTHIVQVLPVWYPSLSNDTLTYISFDQETMITANIQTGVPFNLSPAQSSKAHNMDFYFSSLSEQGVLSLYFKYSDGSVKNTFIEF